MQAVMSLTIAMLALIPAANATEYVDGADLGPTQRNSMHSCLPGFVVTGVHVDKNWLLCDGPFSWTLNAVTDERTDFGLTQTNQFPYTNGRTLHWCGPTRMVTGVQVDKNGFSCADYMQRSGAVLPLGTPFLDGAGGSGATQRSGMHACPAGSVLVGAYFSENAFLCAERSYCTTDGQVLCPSGKQCVIDAVPSQDIHSLTGICR
jgi:hypothetical protein